VRETTERRKNLYRKGAAFRSNKNNSTSTREVKGGKKKKNGIGESDPQAGKKEVLGEEETISKKGLKKGGDLASYGMFFALLGGKK